MAVAVVPTLLNIRPAPRYSTDPDAARKAIAKTGLVAVDLETKGLHPHSTRDAAIGAVILRAADRTFLLEELPEWWPEVMEDKDTKKVATNFKFDAMWMIHDSFNQDRLLTQARNLADPMLKSQLAHRYRTRSGAQKAGRAEMWEPNDLKSILKQYLDVDIGKEIDHSTTDWTADWSPEMIDYMLEDIEYLLPLDQTLDQEILRQGQEQAAWIEQDVVFGMAWMTLNGLAFDAEKWRASQAEWTGQRDHMRKHLKKEMPTVLNLNSQPQLMAAMPSVLGASIPDTKKATLKQLAPHFPAIEMLLEYRHFETLLKNWGPNKYTAKGDLKELGYLEKYTCVVCGRFHPEWRQIGTETSRPACSKPNLCQIPRDKAIRSLFVAPPGFVLASLDYSAIEVLTAAVFAGCPSLLAACATGDPHLATAIMISGDKGMTKSDPRRQNAKIANFGLLFGGGRDGLIKQARDLFDVIMTADEAERVIRDYYSLYPELRGTKNQAYRAMDSPDPVIEVRNAVGFRRYLEGWNRKPTSWLNTWIQSTAAFGMKASFKYLREAGLLPFLCAIVYDELLFEFPEQGADDLVAAAKACMIAGMREVLGARVPVIVDDSAVGAVWL